MGGKHFGIYIMSLILDTLSLRILGDIQVEILSRQLGMIIINTNNKSHKTYHIRIACSCISHCARYFISISGHYKQSLQKDVEHHPHFINREIYSGRRHSGNNRIDLFSEDLGNYSPLKSSSKLINDGLTATGGVLPEH